MSPEVVQALVRLIERKDMSTAAHTWRVVLYTRTLAEEAGLLPDEVDRVAEGAALHDVGKLDIPSAILQKPDKLSREEFEVMKTHTTLGYERLRAMGADDPLVLDLVRHHHERMDGGGYPDALSGDAIPLAARFFAVIDTFDAMTSFRPYRSHMGAQAAREAIAELNAGAGPRYFGPAVEMFTSLHDQGRLEWIMRHFNDSVPVPDHAAITDVRAVARALESDAG